MKTFLQFLHLSEQVEPNGLDSIGIPVDPTIPKDQRYPTQTPEQKEADERQALLQAQEALERFRKEHPEDHDRLPTKPSETDIGAQRARIKYDNFWNLMYKKYGKSKGGTGLDTSMSPEDAAEQERLQAEIDWHDKTAYGEKYPETLPVA